MNRSAIIVENLGKSYRIGQREERYQTFREALIGTIKAPMRRFRTLSERGDGDDLFWALKDVSFAVQPGEVVGIIGRNGAGKSTLLKVLSRITEPTEGCVRMRGRVASLLEVGTGFHPELTGRENIYLNGAILGMRKAEIDRKFDEIVAFSEIEKFLDTPVKRYSSGMYVRLAFAVAAHLDPEILIVDEVLAVGDAEFQKKCLGKMKQVASGGGRTVLFVSHNMPAVQSLCSRAVQLVGGRVTTVGAVDDVVSDYLAGAHRGLQALYQNEAYEEGAGGAHLLRAEILDAIGKPCTSVRFGEPFGVRMVWRNFKAIPALSYTWRVFNNMDSLVFSSNTINIDDIDVSREGDLSLVARCETNVLPPGHYRVEVGAWIRPHTKLQVIEDCLSLIVDERPYDPEWRFNITGRPAAVSRVFWKEEPLPELVRGD